MNLSSLASKSLEWTITGLVGVSILANLYVMIYTTLKEVIRKIKVWRNGRKVANLNHTKITNNKFFDGLNEPDSSNILTHQINLTMPEAQLGFNYNDELVYCRPRNKESSKNHIEINQDPRDS